jgi:hypothetical protein
MVPKGQSSANAITPEGTFFWKQEAEYTARKLQRDWRPQLYDSEREGQHLLTLRCKQSPRVGLERDSS